MLKASAMILGVKGPSNQHCIGGGEGMREFAVFLRKCPKTFGQDCRSELLGTNWFEEGAKNYFTNIKVSK